MAFLITSHAYSQNCYQVFCYADECCPILPTIQCSGEPCPPIIMINDDVNIEEHTAQGWFGDEFNPVWDPDGCVYLKASCVLNDPPCEYAVEYSSCRQASNPEKPFDCPP